jgi:hypothetical protein
MMNERIKQLMDQAGIDVEAVENLGEMPAAIKFAELIVRQCTGVLFDESEKLSELSFNEDSWQAAKEYEICSDQCIDNIAVIEKHFGVEE